MENFWSEKVLLLNRLRFGGAYGPNSVRRFRRDLFPHLIDPSFPRRHWIVFTDSSPPPDTPLPPLRHGDQTLRDCPRLVLR